MKASFIDLGGNTARVDPQTTPTSYIRLQIFWQAVYDDRSGAEANSPRAGEIYMTVEQAGVLAEALKNARMPEAQETPPALAKPFTIAQRERMFRNRPSDVGKGLSLADWHRVVQYVEACHGIGIKKENGID